MENKTINSETSNKSTRSTRRKTEILPLTLISSIERDINELQQELTTRSQKNKLISINETFKIISKKIISDNNQSTINLNTEESERQISPSKHSDELIKNYENEIKKLKDEKEMKNKANSNYEKNLLKKEEMIQKQNNKIDELKILLSDERNSSSEYLLRIKILEETLKKLDKEYESVVDKISDSTKDKEHYEKILTDMKKNTNENKNKFEELVKINNDLKTKIINLENTQKLHLDEMRSQLKKNSNLQKHIEELEKNLKSIEADSSYKEDRLKVIRHMNTKLENKCQQILKKWDSIKLMEEKAHEESIRSNKLSEMIEKLSESINQLQEDNEMLVKKLEQVSWEKNRLNSEMDELKKQFVLVKISNDELLSKNKDMENKFKSSLDTNRNDKKGYTSSTMRNIKEKNEIQLEELRPAKLLINKNTLEIK